MKLPTVVLGDDHRIIVDGLRRLLAGDVDVIASCGDGAELYETVTRLRPAVMVTDISMPSLTGLQVVRKLAAAGAPTRSVVLSMFADEATVAAALRAGANAYVPKNAAGDELLTAIRAVLAGEQYVSRLVAQRPTGERPSGMTGRLTQRQREVLAHLASGKTMKEIAAAMQLSRRTVEMHKYHMMRALGVKTNAALIEYFVKNEMPLEAFDARALVR